MHKLFTSFLRAADISPVAEGITVDGDGLVYIASERDNSAKGVNFNMILVVNPHAQDGSSV